MVTDGAWVPKMRFVGEHGESFEEWDTKKMKEIIVEAPKKKVENPELIKTLTVKLHCKGVVGSGNSPNITPKSRPYYERNTGELIIGRQNFHNGGIALVTEECDKLIASNAISSFVAKNNNSLLFAFYLLSRKEYYEKTERDIGGTGQKEISVTQIGNLQAAIPSLPEQQKIATFLTTLDHQRDLQQRRVVTLHTMKQGWLQQLFNQTVRFLDEQGEVFPEWEEVRLGDVVTIVSGGTPDTEVDSYWNGDVTWLTPTEIHHQKYVTSSKRTLSQEGLRKCSAQVLPIGAILLTTRATLGEMAIVAKPLSTNQGFQSLIASEKIANEFLYYMKPKFKEYFHSRANGSTFKEIGKREIQNFQFEAPSLREQQKIATFLTTLDQLIELEERRLAALDRQKQAFLQQLFV